MHNLCAQSLSKVKVPLAKIKEFISRKEVWYAFFILLILKSIYLIVARPAFEIDSWNYIECVLSFDYPPLYPYFIYLLRLIYPNAYFTCFIQVVILAAAVAVFASFVFKDRKYLIVFSILVGLDPASSYYACSFMSEALFIPFLLIYVVLLYKAFQFSKYNSNFFLILGACIGVMYSVRFVGIVFLIPPVLLIFLLKQMNLRSVKHLIWILIGFQLSVLPIRYKYKTNFNTYQFNGFSGRILWNNASAIYPASKVRKTPQNEFEKYLMPFPDSYFTADLAIRGRQLWEDTLPLRKYGLEQKLKFNEMPHYNQMILQTAKRIILDQPWLYFKKQVIPGFLTILKEPAIIYPKGYEAGFFKTYQFKIRPQISIHREMLWFYLSLFVLISLFVLLKGPHKHIVIVLLTICWVYIALIPFVGIQDSRLYLILSLPILTICVLMMKKQSAN